MSDSQDPFADKTYKGFGFSNADMAEAKFDGVNLSNATFWAVLENAKFTDSNLTACVFDDVNLGNSRFENVNLSDTSFNNLNMAGASFSNLNLSDAVITDANLKGMTINGVLVSDLFAAFEKNNDV